MPLDGSRELEAAKLEALRQFAYGAGHELNNPLANIAARAQTLLRDEPDPQRRHKLAAINAQAMRAHEMIADLMLFARPPQPAPERCDAVALVVRLANELAPDAEHQETALETALPADPLWIVADPKQLAVAVRTLVANALEALGSGGRVSLAVHDGPDSTNSRADRSAACIEVADNGPGIPPDVRPHVFDPFFSGREAGRGLGLGLCKCWRIVTGNGGTISVSDTPGGGATFSLVLPAADTSA